MDKWNRNKKTVRRLYNFSFMQRDRFLDSMRDNERFQKILEKAKEKHLAFKKRFF